MLSVTTSIAARPPCLPLRRAGAGMSPRLQVRAVAAAGSQPADIADTRRKWAALREAQLTSKGAEHLSGTGTTLNLDKTWSLLCADSSSSFLESVFIRLPDGNDREYRAAFDEEAGVAWQEDMNGFALVLESEDVDKHLLSTWLRSGQWLGHAWGKLEFAAPESPVAPTFPDNDNGAPAPTPEKAATGKGKSRQGKKGRPADKDGADADVSSCPVLAVRLSGSSYRALLWVDPDTALPRRLELPSGSGGPEAWTFADWPAEPEKAGAPLVPRRVVRTSPTGQLSVFACAAAAAPAAQAAPPQPPPPWALPPAEQRQRAGHGTAAFLPADAANPAAAAAGALPSAEVPAARCEGGQFLVAGSLSGVRGWFLLDSACDTLAVSRSAAAAAALPPRFGQQAVFGVGGPVVSALRLAPRFRVGGLELTDPLAMELQLDGAVRLPSAGPSGGQPLPLLGVLGGALLLRSVVEISAPKRAPGSRDAPKVTVAVHDPATYQPDPRVAVSWQEVTFIDGAPHVAAGFDVETEESVAGQARALEALRDLGAPDGEGGGGGGGPGAEDVVPRLREREGFGGTRDGALFKVGLGLGGAPAVLGARSARRLQFAERTVALAPTGLVSGPGSEQGRLSKVEEGSVISGRIAALELKGARFEGVRCLAHTGPADPPDLGLSEAAAGVLCADLFRGCRVVLDFGRKRMAVVQH